MTYAGLYCDFGSSDFENTVAASGGLDINSPRWIHAFESKLDTFRSYRAGWDSYGASTISEDALESARRFLDSALFSDLEKPFVAPTSTGGIHVEWNRDGKALELEFVSLTELHYFYSDSSSTVEKEEELFSDFEEARVAVRDFAE